MIYFFCCLLIINIVLALEIFSINLVKDLIPWKMKK